MSKASNELMDFADHMLSSVKFNGCQCYRTAIHKSYYSLYHYFLDLYPNAIIEGKRELNKTNESAGSHKSLREGLRLEALRKSGLEKINLLEAIKDLQALCNNRVKSDYKFDFNITAKFAEESVLAAKDVISSVSPSP